MTKKTMQVESIKEYCNELLAGKVEDNKWLNPQARIGIATVLEHILHETGNYHGFNYVEWLDGGCEKWRADGCPEDNTSYLGDQTKVYYY